ncbi:MAG: exo-alpha-sialidase [Verrucomicrobia bacterium]|nr:exo-alpha-sialidase [Verrucomicrobiota bacterium]
MPVSVCSRRAFLQSGAALAASTSCALAQAGTQRAEFIASIEKVTLRWGRDGSGPTWFHPRCCVVPTTSGSMVLMTLQTIAGSDYFGPVHSMTTRDLGKTWTDPQPVPPLGRVQPGNNLTEEGVCDVTPEWHPQTKSVLALGHNVFYSGPRFSADQPPRWPIYAVWRDGKWGPRRKLYWNDPRGAYIYSNNCGQRIVLPNGDIQMSFTFGATKSEARAVTGVICGFDGETLTVKHVGEPITNAKGRGLLEPSVTQFNGRFFLTIRAEDSRGYVCASEDGLKWTPKQPWAWEDGMPLDLSTTQQHWLTHSDALFLVYTRKDASNVNVLRWRAPLWVAQVDPRTLRLRRDTERVVLPLVGDGVKDPDRVAIMGNFHTTNVSPDESWVTVGEWQPKNGIKGDLLLARIRWHRPNRLAG